MAKQVYRTMQGKIIDMDALMSNNETMPAVGNVKMNARGDELGPGGKIIKTKEELMSEYYEDNPNAIPRAVNKENKVTQSTVEVKVESAVKNEKPVAKSKVKEEVSIPLPKEGEALL